MFSLDDLDFFYDLLRSILAFRKSFVSVTKFAKIKLLQGRRYLKLMIGQRCSWLATSVSFLVLLMCMVDLNSTSAALFSVIHKPKCTLASLTSFGMMFGLNIYLVLLLFRFRGYYKKRRVRRCRVSSCLWTRRKVF